MGFSLVQINLKTQLFSSRRVLGVINIVDIKKRGAQCHKNVSNLLNHGIG